MEPSGTIIALPEYLKVEFIQTSEIKSGNIVVEKRDQFKILEGVHKGEFASVKQDPSGRSNLGKPLPAYGGPAAVVFNRAKKELTYQGNKKTRAITDPTAPTPLGAHNIQIPDFPHDIGRRYLVQTPYALSWFFIGQGRAVLGRNERYLHTGELSLGCVTVDPSGWTDLYKYLILCRKGDDYSVGTIRVIN